MDLKPTIDLIVQQIVEEVSPVRLILFGSAARDQCGPDSDIDILVVVRNGVHRRQTAQKIYRKLAGSGVATDVVVVTEEDLTRYALSPSLVISAALRDGRELYAA